MNTSASLITPTTTSEATTSAAPADIALISQIDPAMLGLIGGGEGMVAFG